VKLYRLERNGWGVFCPASFMPRMLCSSDALYTWYGFSCDRKYQWENDWRCACESIEKLVEYFGSDFAWALDMGASIVEYRVPKKDIRFGTEGIEVVFKADAVIERLVILKGDDVLPPIHEAPPYKFDLLQLGDTIKSVLVS
jgi:hypothetical protein